VQTAAKSRLRGLVNAVSKLDLSKIQQKKPKTLYI